MKGVGKQSGLTLVELLIASTLGLLLTLGVAQLFVSSSDSFRMAESIGRMQESGRLTQDILGRSIRNADYWGCLNHSQVDSILNESSGGYDANLHDFSEPDAVQFDIGNGTHAASGTVVVRVKGATGQSLLVDTGLSGTGGSEINTRSVPATSLPAGQFDVGGLALLVNCDDAVVFRVSGTNTANNTIALDATVTNGGTAILPGNEAAGSCEFGSTLANCFPETFYGGNIFSVYSERFYIREDSGRRSLVFAGINGSGVFNRQEIVSDVMDLQIRVGSGPQGDNIINNWQTVTAANLANINDTSVTYVKAVKVSVLVRSPENGVAGSSQSACYPAWSDCSAGDNWQAPAGDRHYYRVYTSTYSIRNRLLNTGP